MDRKEAGQNGVEPSRAAHKATSEGSQAQTVRQMIIQLLHQRDMSARDLSRAVGIREREVYDHLNHIGHTMAARGNRLLVPPFACFGCGYVFRNRNRYTRPGRCPRCKGTHLQVPTFRLSKRGGT